MSSQRKLAIIGAGPKAIAVSIKFFLLAKEGFPVPEIHIFEKNAVAANWSSHGNFTNGKLQLGTPAEMDLGFPYNTHIFDKTLNEKINAQMIQYSFIAFLMEKKEYVNWVLKGNPAPTHQKWSMYLIWAFNKIKHTVSIHFSLVTRLTIIKDQWAITAEKNNTTFTEHFDALLLTGPGACEQGIRSHPETKLFSTEDFWKNIPCWSNNQHIKSAIIGSGEQAAAIADTLLKNNPDNLLVDIICARGTALTRGDSFSENRFYADMAGHEWKKMPLAIRKNFIKHTDVGVFSGTAMKKIEQTDCVNYIFGKSSTTPIYQNNQWQVTIQQGNTTKKTLYDAVIFATGYKQLAWANTLFDDKAIKRISMLSDNNTWSEYALSQLMDENLKIAGLNPSLYWPMLASLNEGPGFSNLCCLGALSDRICWSEIQNL